MISPLLRDLIGGILSNEASLTGGGGGVRLTLSGRPKTTPTFRWPTHITAAKGFAPKHEVVFGRPLSDGPRQRPRK